MANLEVSMFLYKTLLYADKGCVELIAILTVLL